jgi:hypothetical protein
MELESYPYSIITERLGFILFKNIQTFRVEFCHVRHFLSAIFSIGRYGPGGYARKLGTDVWTEWVPTPIIRRRGEGDKRRTIITSAKWKNMMIMLSHIQ